MMLENIIVRLREADNELKEANELKKGFDQAVSQSADLQDRLKLISLRLSRNLNSLSVEVNKTLKSLRNTEDGAAVTAELSGAIHTLERRCNQLRETQLQTRSIFLRMVLGRVNVRCFSDPERVRLRDEYNKFKLRATAIFVLFPCIVLFFHYYLRHAWSDTQWINVIYHLWLLYYFMSLALRENILLVNGSNIKPWWIYHHYLSALVVVVFLIWPSTPLYISFVPYVTCFCLYMGLTQVLQIVFYKKRDYTNRALGKTAHMDVSYPETITELPRELLILVPFLLIGYVWQLSLGVSFCFTLLYKCDLFGLHWTQYTEELQIAFSGVFSLILGAGNFINVLFTIYSKVTKVRQTQLQIEEREQLERLLQRYCKPKET